MLSKVREYYKYLVPFILGVFLFALITNFDGTVQFLGGLWGSLWYVLSRILGGFGLAYILNIFVKFLRKRLKFPNWLAIVGSYVVFLGAVVWLILYIIPYIVSSVNQLIDIALSFEDEAKALIGRAFPLLDERSIEDFVDAVYKQMVLLVSDINMMAVLPMVQAVGRTLLNISFWLLISVYALIDKDRLLNASKRIMRAFLQPQKVSSRIKFCREANEIFSRYISGKLFESLIIGALSLILYLIFGLKMAPFLAFLAFVFNMIPIFGPLIGGAISVLILLFFSPLQALYCLFISVALQTLDGSVIAPKILGDSVGLSPLLTIIAISVGGDLAGLLGIFLSVPVFATFKILVIDRVVERRLARREAGRGEESGKPET